MASFANILLSGPATNEGRLEISSDAVVWVSRAGDAKREVPLANVKAAAWYDTGRAFQLWLTDNAGELYRFDGFKSIDFDRVGTAISAGSGGAVKLVKRALGTKGQNWGTLRVNGRSLELLDAAALEDGGKAIPIATIPLASVSQVAQPGKGEVEVQFVDEDTMEREDEACVEMRLFVPMGHRLPDADKAAAAARERAKTKAKGGAGTASDDEDIAEAIEAAGADPAAQVHALISSAAGVGATGTGDAVADFPAQVGQFLVPRGRFAVEMFPSFMRLTGSSYEFKVAYKSIARMFYLPKPPSTGGGGSGDETRYYFVIALDEPLRHGAQRHPHLVLQLDRRPLAVDLNVSEEDIKAGRYEGLGKDTKRVEGEEPRVVASLFKSMTGKPIYKPGGFFGASKYKAVRASVKADDGQLYPLDKSLLFVHKPTTWIRYSDIDHVEMRRGGSESSGMASVSKSWDLAVVVKASAGVGREVVFSSIDRAEREPLKSFLTEKGVSVVDKGGSAGAGALAAAVAADDDDDDEEEDDEDYGGEDSGSDDDDDDAGEEEDEDDDDGGKRKSKSKPKKSSGGDASGKKRSRKEFEKSKKPRKGGDDDEDGSDAEFTKRKNKGKGTKPKRSRKDDGDDDE